VVEDAAHRSGNSRKMVGTIATSLFFFLCDQTITTVKAGWDDKQPRVRSYAVMSLHGISKDAWKLLRVRGLGIIVIRRIQI